VSRGVYRGIYSALPDDPDFQRLSPDARLTLLVARVCHQAGPAAIFRYYPELLRLQTGLSAKRLEAAFVELEVGNWIYRDGSVMWIRNGLRHDPTTTLANKLHKISIIRWLDGLPKERIVLKFCDYYKLPYPFEAHVNGLPSPSESKDSDSESDSEKDSESDNTLRGVANDATTPPPSAQIGDADRKFLESLPDPYRVQWLGSPDWWLSLGDGYPGVNLQREASKYMAYQDSQSAGQKHRNVRKGFRAWVAKAARWLEQDAMRKAVRR
jgi:hypothetical protein